MATLETSPEANCDRQTDRQNDKATYRGLSSRSDQTYASALPIKVASNKVTVFVFNLNTLNCYDQ